MIVVLIFLVTSLVMISYYVGNRDISNPVFICIAAFWLSVVSASYNVTIWNMQLSDKTVLLIILSLLSMIMFGGIGLKIRTNGTYSHLKQEIQYINIKTYKIVIILILGIISTYFYINNIIRIASKNGYVSGDGFTTLLVYYRNAAHFYSTNIDNAIKPLTSYMMELYKVSAHIVTYVGINNLIVSKRKDRKKCFIFFSPTILYAISTILSAGRMRLLQLFIYIAIVSMILYKKKNGWNKKFSIKALFKILMSILAIFIGFVAIRGIIGRNSSTAPLYYFTSYSGGSIELLDLFIKDPVPSSDIWGKETFYSIYNFLGRKLSIPEWRYEFAKEFRFSSSGVEVGNVYTALRCFYYDFGFWGCVISSGIFGFIYSLFYKYIKSKRFNTKIDLSIIIYAYIFYAMAMFGINYYVDFLSGSYIKTFVFFFIVRWFLNYQEKRNLISYGR